MILDRTRQEDDAFLEQARINVVGAFTAIGLFHNHRHEGHSGIDWVSHVRPLSTSFRPDAGIEKMHYPT